MRRPLLLVALVLSACTPVAVQVQPPSPTVVQKITAACVQSGLFKAADGLLTFALPAASLPVSVLNAGVDKVCADPAAFASDISTVEWVIRNTLAAFRS